MINELIIKKNNKGFTLVELIVVVLIIAIIAAVLAPQVVKYVGQAKTNADKHNAAVLKTEVQAAVANYVAQGYGFNLSLKATPSEYYLTPNKNGKPGTGWVHGEKGSAVASWDQMRLFILEETGSDIPQIEEKGKNTWKASIDRKGAVNIETIYAPPRKK